MESRDLMRVGADRLQALRSLPFVARTLYGLRDGADRLLQRVDLPPLGATVHGDVRLTGYLRHRAFLESLASHDYEEYSLHLFLEAVRPECVVVDGGAHIGLYSLLADRVLGPTGRVFAFEADLYNFRALQKNLAVNRARAVTPRNVALADSPGSVRFYASSSTIASSIVDRTPVTDAHIVDVPATSVDAELMNWPVEHVVMKLDVEGAEERVLVGAAESLGSCRSGRVIVEHNPGALADGGSSGAAVVDLLRAFGFEVFFVDEGARAIVSIRNRVAALGKGNLVANKGME